MALKKDKPKVLDEVWTEDRIRGFLDLQAPDGFSRDFHRLLKAYQSMRDDDFEQFIAMAVAAGINLEAAGPDGNSIKAIASQHRRSAAFVSILDAAGG